MFFYIHIFLALALFAPPTRSAPYSRVPTVAARAPLGGLAEVIGLVLASVASPSSGGRCSFSGDKSMGGHLVVSGTWVGAGVRSSQRGSRRSGRCAVSLMVSSDDQAYQCGGDQSGGCKVRWGAPRHVAGQHRSSPVSSAPRPWGSSSGVGSLRAILQRGAGTMRSIGRGGLSRGGDTSI